MQFLKSTVQSFSRLGTAASLFRPHEAQGSLFNLNGLLSRSFSLSAQNFKMRKNPNNDGILNVPPHLRHPPRPFQRWVRNYFPVPHEVKRIRRHGLDRRLSTAAGRKIIASRICKGKYVLAHGW